MGNKVARYVARVRYRGKAFIFICNARNRESADKMLKQHLAHNSNEPPRYKWRLSKRIKL